MDESDGPLTPAKPEDVRITLALALTRGDRLARNQGAEAMASVVSERLVAALEKSGFVIMSKPTPMHTYPTGYPRRGDAE